MLIVLKWHVNYLIVFSKILILISLLNSLVTFSQDEGKIEIHADYQTLKYDYLQIGFGFAPKKHLISINRDNKSFSFIGYRLSYSDNVNNSDWGVALQSLVLGGDFRNFPGFGIEVNYKSVSQNSHIGIKPLIGLSFPYINIMYGYNFDLNKTKSERVSQHELIIGLSLNVFKW